MKLKNKGVHISCAKYYSLVYEHSEKPGKSALRKILNVLIYANVKMLLSTK